MTPIDAAVANMARAATFLLTLAGEAPAVTRVDRHGEGDDAGYVIHARDKHIVWAVGMALETMMRARGARLPYIVQSPGRGSIAPGVAVYCAA